MEIPDTLKWKTVETLGQGGQGVVHKVVEKNNPNSVFYALKALSLEKPKKAYERFYREIEAIKKLDNPFIIKIFDHSNPDNKFHYYVMEYIEGATPLKSLLNSNNNPFFKDVIKSLKLFDQMIDAILSYNSQGVIHRDLSPANILITSDNAIKIIDFGICQTENHETITLIDENLGTRNYAPPECEVGTENGITILADVYSIGKILWLAIVNQNAFAREEHVFKTRSMKSIFPNMPNAWHLHHIFEKTIRKNPKDRATPDQLKKLCALVSSLVLSGYPPLDSLDDKCSICGLGKLNVISKSGQKDYLSDRFWQFIQFKQGDHNFCIKVCDKCGYTSMWNGEPLKKYLDGINKLE